MVHAALLSVAAWRGEEFGGEWIRDVWLSTLHCSSESITTLLISYTPIHNKKFKNKIKSLHDKVWEN